MQFFYHVTRSSSCLALPVVSLNASARFTSTLTMLVGPYQHATIIAMSESCRRDDSRHQEAGRQFVALLHNKVCGQAVVFAQIVLDV
jgi:hypothetical protein